MTRFRRDLCQRFQDEAASVHGGMRNRQAPIFDDGVAKQENIEVDGARPFFLASLPSHLLLNLDDAGEKLCGRLLRIQFDGAIQKPRLRGEFYRFGFVER